MPITGSLGALSYSRGGDVLNWALTLGTDLQFSDLLLNDTSLYTVGYNNSPAANYPDPDGDTTIVKIALDAKPYIEWQTQLDPTINKFEVTSINGVSDTLFPAPPLPHFNFVDNTPVRFFGGVFGGVVGDTQTYYILNSTFNSFQIALGPGGSAVNVTSSSGSMFVISQTADQSGYLETNRLAYDTIANKLLITGTFNSVNLNVNVSDGNGFYGTTTFVTSQGNFDFNFKNIASKNQNGNGDNPNMETFDVVQISSAEYICSSRCTWDNTTFGKVDLLTKFNSSGTVLLQEEIDSSTLTAPFPRLVQLSTGDIIMSHQLVTSVPAVGDRYAIQNIDPSNFTVNWQFHVDISQDRITDIVKDSNDNIFILTVNEHLVKTNSSGTVLYQKKYTGADFLKCVVDANDDLYVIGSSGKITKINGSTGALEWSNDLSLSNVTTPVAGLSLNTQSIRVDETSVYVLANLNEVGGSSPSVVGVIYKLPNDGTIPGSGVYLIDNPDTVYQLNYQTNTVTVSTTSFTFNTTVYQLDPLTSDSALSTFTDTTGTLNQYINRLA